MSDRPVTLELPEPIFRQLARIAEATQQSVEALALQSIASNLPPHPDNAPPEMQVELLEMSTLPIEELLAFAQAEVEPQQHDRHVKLLDEDRAGLLTPEERQELINLRLAADRLMLRKAYAWSLLRWRGYRIPPLQELAVPS